MLNTKPERHISNKLSFMCKWLLKNKKHEKPNKKMHKEAIGN